MLFLWSSKPRSIQQYCSDKMRDKVFKYAGKVTKLYDIETTCTSRSRRKQPPRRFHSP